MIVRRAAHGDAAGIATAHVCSWQAAYRGILSDSLLDGLSIEQRTERWLGSLAEDPVHGRCTIVAERNGTIVGFAHAAASRDADADPATVGELIAIYVRPDVFGRGVGPALMATGLDWFAGKGYHEASLWVLDGNTRAIGFYDRTGWTADGTRKGDVIGGEPVTELRYRRPVTR